MVYGQGTEWHLARPETHFDYGANISSVASFGKNLGTISQVGPVSPYSELEWWYKGSKNNGICWKDTTFIHGGEIITGGSRPVIAMWIMKEFMCVFTLSPSVVV